MDAIILYNTGTIINVSLLEYKQVASRWVAGCLASKGIIRSLTCYLGRIGDLPNLTTDCKRGFVVRTGKDDVTLGRRFYGDRQYTLIAISFATQEYEWLLAGDRSLSRLRCGNLLVALNNPAKGAHLATCHPHFHKYTRGMARPPLTVPFGRDGKYMAGHVYMKLKLIRYSECLVSVREWYSRFDKRDICILFLADLWGSNWHSHNSCYSSCLRRQTASSGCQFSGDLGCLVRIILPSVSQPTVCIPLVS